MTEPLKRAEKRDTVSESDPLGLEQLGKNRRRRVRPTAAEHQAMLSSMPKNRDTLSDGSRRGRSQIPD